MLNQTSNSQEDTLWLSELSLDLLNEAIIWPHMMMKLVHFFGLLSSIFLVSAIFNEHLLVLIFSITILIGSIYKGVNYSEDIILIRNELSRRKKSA